MEKRCKIYYTSDTHGRLFPEDGVGERCLTACFAEYQKDENTLVLDGGDTLQGAPLLRYLWKHDDCPHMLAQTMNHGGLDYYTLGNHDFNYGYDPLARYVQGGNATCLCANVQDVSGQMKMKPYAIHTLGNGLRIGVVGVVTEYVNLWEAEENLRGLVVTDPFTAAKKALEELKSVENTVDYTICIYHGGFEEDITQITEGANIGVDSDANQTVQHGKRANAATAQASDAARCAPVQSAPAQAPTQSAPNPTANPNVKPQENVGCKICRELNFDLLLTAHQHMEQPLRMLYGTAVLQLPPNADKYACIELGVDVPDDSLAGDAGIAAQGNASDPAGQQRGVSPKNTVVSNMDKSTMAKSRARIIRAAHIAPTAAPDPAFLAKTWPLRMAAAHWLAQPAGTLMEAIPAETDKIKLALGTAKIAQLANFAQRQASGAEVAITALPNQTVSLPQRLSIGDVLTAYPFPNAVMTLAVRGDILAQGIARSASYFAKDAQGALHVARAFVSPKEEHYNYDFFAGVEYSISFEKAQGGGAHEQTTAPTVSNIMVNGAPLDPARTYTVAMSDYRATGTGGYDFYASCPRIASYPVDLQELILETLAATPNLCVPAQSAVHLLG